MNYQQLYDRMAPFYGPLMRLLPVWRRYIDAVRPWLPQGRALLEIGPGPGYLLAQVAGRYPLAVGLDLSAGMLRRAGAAAPTARLVQGNAVHLPFAPASFDAVALTFVFSAIPDGLAAMREFHRVLRPGGTLALVDAGNPSNGNLPGRLLARTWQLFGDFMRDEAALMREVGFEIVARREFGAFDGIRLVAGRR